MKLSRKLWILLGVALAARADLGTWIQHLASPARIEAALFRSVSVPTGATEILRPAKEAQDEVSKLIVATPSDGSLYALRAREDEQALDVAAAESDWKKQLELAQDKAAAELDLADFYARRIRPRDELNALLAAVAAASLEAEHFTAPNRQRSWQAFARMLGVIQAQLLSADLAGETYRAWIARYPREREPYSEYFDFLVAQKQFPEAGRLLADYRKSFPDDAVYPVQAAAALAGKQGSVEDALRVYDSNFQPFWPPTLIKSYFDLLQANQGLRRFLEQARAQANARPTDLNPAARLFYYYQQAGNLPAAQRALLDFRQRKESAKSPWTSAELKTLAELFAGALNYDEAARHYYAMYSIQSADASAQEPALAALAQLLLDAPEAPIHFGSGDLSLYRDIATMDRDPGFLNGVLSLLLNSTEPSSRYDAENQASLPYFHRAKAAELIGLFNTRFPKSARRPGLETRLISAYATYGDNDGVIRAGKAFLTEFPQAVERPTVALAMADAYARTEQVNAEFGIYDDLLKELAVKAEGMPIGQVPSAPANGGQPRFRTGSESASETPQARSPQYALVLERYISRLVALKRLREALALYRREIDANANDPGLYERLAGFLDQNKMSADLELTYRKAMAQFPNSDWSHKLARWYLRQKQTAQYEQLTRDVTKIFSGSQMEAYVRETGAGQALSPLLYRQVNLYAHQRFPHDLVFVDNLLKAYAQKATYDDAASEALLRRFWFYSPSLRDRLFERLSSSNRLNAELVSLSSVPVNAAVQTMQAEAQAWQSHFETAAPLFQTLAGQYPGDAALNTRAAMLYRSLATVDISNTRTAAALAENLTRYNPRDENSLTLAGEIYADREMFAQAGPQWNRIAEVNPGLSGGYLQAATVFWDYFQYDDALRLMARGRQQLSKPALFAYEIGAIHEDRREYRQAVEEYAKGAWSDDGAAARGRLIQLARRPRDRDLIEDVTAKAAAGNDPLLGAVSLRVDVLNAQNRRGDLQALLIGLGDRASAPELLTYVQDTGRAQGFDMVEEHVLVRQTALATDPVEKMRNWIALTRFYESHKNSDAAARAISALYKDNPAILGVVRATVDYYWRNKNTQGAIDALVQAAASASPDYRKQFTFEAARKATDAADYNRARTLLATLRKVEPFNGEYTAAVADTYGRQGDDRGLRDFYLAELDSLKKAGKPEAIAGLRRGLIPVLTRLNDFAGAVDQYIEIVNRYPEDDDLTREAALYAQAHNRGLQLIGYYEKTASDSPKDYRWPMVLARAETQLEDFPAAISAYNRATTIRPDRVDLYTARAALEERTLRLDEAAATYGKLYELTYHNTAWMEKLALVRARQQQTDAAIQALRKALIDGRPDQAQNYFIVAGRLEEWGLLKQAREYAEKGVALAGDRLLVENSSGALVYARVMTRLRAYPAALAKIQAAVPKNADQPTQIDGVLRQIGTVAAQFYTPEEKVQLAAFLNAGPPQQNVQRARRYLSVAEAAGLLDLQVKWKMDLLDPGQMPEQIEQLQNNRLQYAEYAGQLERYWKIFPADKDGRDSLLVQAANKYRLAGETASEYRVLTQLDQIGMLSGALIPRYASLLNTRAPQQLNILAAADKSETVRDEIVTYGIQNLSPTRALALIAARGRGLPPVWTKAYTGLAGLYLSYTTPGVTAAFRDALGVGSIGEHLAKPADAKAQLVGESWYDYGTHYGEYEQLAKQADADDYLPAVLEGAPASAEAYFRLAEIYREAGRMPQAAADYRNALQLSTWRGDAYDRLALIAIQESKRDEAAHDWSLALQGFAWQQDQSKAPPEFWDNVNSALVHIGKHNMLAAVRADADKLLRTYIRRNGSWQADPLMKGALAAAGDPAAGVAWILDLARSATDHASFLRWLSRAAWLPETQRAAVYQAAIDAAGAVVTASFGDARVAAENDWRTAQIEFAEYLVNHQRANDAAQIVSSLPEDYRKQREGQIASLDVRIAAQNGTLPALLERYRRDANPPPSEDLQRAANELSRNGNAMASRQVLEYLYVRQLDTREFTQAAFLGLAEIRLDQNDLANAVTLLRRMTNIVGEPFENLTEAGGLLLRKGHPAEATEFLKARVQAQPWDEAAKAMLGRATADAGLLATVAGSSAAPYSARVDAARSLREAKAVPLKTNSAELNLLSSAAISLSEAEKPYAYAARVDAAGRESDPAVKLRLLRGAVAIDPSHTEDKVQIFKIAYAAKLYQTAVAALYPLHPFSPEDEPYESAAPDFLPLRELADAYAKLGQWKAALYFYRTGKQSDSEIQALEAQVELQALNEKRRPKISAKLEQDHLILPRLKQGASQ